MIELLKELRELKRISGAEAVEVIIIPEKVIDQEQTDVLKFNFLFFTADDTPFKWSADLTGALIEDTAMNTTDWLARKARNAFNKARVERTMGGG